MTTKTALIIGASRGLGLGLVERLSEDGWKVVATVRDTAKAGALEALPGVQVQSLEMNSASQLEALQTHLEGQVFDLLFVNAGVKGPDNQDAEVAQLADIGDLFMTNSVAPIRVAQRFAGQLREGSGVIAFMSSVLGSVGIPDAPDLALYKASKAALNSMINSFVVRLGETRLSVLAMHPGWVKTDMGGEDAPMTPEEAAEHIYTLALSKPETGQFWFKGERYPW